MNEIKMYRCNICGNLVCMVEDSGVNPFCCNEPMEEVKINYRDFSEEKHLPVISEKDRRVSIRVGEIDHPMTENHFIEWIILMTDRCFYAKTLSPGTEPTADFIISDNEKVLSSFAFCNIHGLWHTTIG